MNREEWVEWLPKNGWAFIRENEYNREYHKVGDEVTSDGMHIYGGKVFLYEKTLNYENECFVDIIQFYDEFTVYDGKIFVHTAALYPH